jgi:hypothetical protein
VKTEPGKEFAELAARLAERDRALAEPLAEARAAAEELRGHAERALARFTDAARAEGAEHLTDFTLGPVRPDDKHVDALEFSVRRGRWELICVAKAGRKFTLVGPFKRGKPEKPCLDYPLSGDELRAGLEARLLELIRAASEL